MNLEGWCEDIGLPNIYYDLKEFVESPVDLTEASKEDITEIIEECGLEMKEKLKFKRAIRALKASSDEKKSDESTSTVGRNPIAPRKSGVFLVPTLKKKDIKGPWKTIFVTGQTGAGKSTTLNSMVNFLWNVRVEDKYRFNLIPPPKENSHGTTQSKSVTQLVSSYHIKPPGLPYGLTVVDSPGFGDTQGVGQDQKIMKRIRQHFEQELETVDAICFVIKSSANRLNKAQEYIFNQMLKLFARDVSKNVFILFTFCDGNEPPALAAVKAAKLPHGKHFLLNNSAFFVGFSDAPVEPLKKEYLEPGYTDPGTFNKKTVAANTRMFWNFGREQLDIFFKELGQVQPQSLTLTKEVLSEREGMQLAIADLQIRIDLGLRKLQDIRQQIEYVKVHAKQINKNANFKVPYMHPEARQVPTSNNTTTCTACPGMHTCHESCAYSNNADKQHCCAIDSSTGYCRVCPNRCHWSQHMNKPFMIVKSQVRKYRTVGDKKALFDKATAGMSNAERLVIDMTREFVAIQKQVQTNIKRVRKAIERLNEIAMRPCLLGEAEYFDMMITSEEETRDPGYQERIAEIKVMKAQAESLSRIASSEAGEEQKMLFREAMQKISRDLEEIRRIQSAGSSEAQQSFSSRCRDTVRQWFSL